MIKLLVGKGHLGSYMAAKWNIPDHRWWKGRMDTIPNTFFDEARNQSILLSQPVALINTAGKTDLKWCEENPAETFYTNTVGPVKLARQCRDFGISFIHISSGCLWDGPYDKAGNPFTPHHNPTPACYYSWTKAAADAMLIMEDIYHVCILRPRQIYSSVKSPRNTIDKLIGYDSLLDTPNSMTSIDTILKTVDLVIEKHKFNRIYNVYDIGVSSPFKVGIMLKNAGLKKFAARRLEKSELDEWHKPKRVDTVLHDPEFEELVHPPKVEEELERVIAEYAKINKTIYPKLEAC